LLEHQLQTKKNLDLQVALFIAKFIYATNSAFRYVEHPEFIKLINLLQQG